MDGYNGILRFPDHRPFVGFLGIFDDLSFKRAITIIRSATVTSSGSATSKSIYSNSEYVFAEYGQGMTREEVGTWDGSHSNNFWVVPIINVESFNPNSFGPSIQPHLNKTRLELIT